MEQGDEDVSYTLTPDYVLACLVDRKPLHWRHIVRFAFDRLDSNMAIVPKAEQDDHSELLSVLADAS